MNAPTHQALAEGELGIALLHIERGDLNDAGTLVSVSIAGGVSCGGNASLYHGAPALEFVLGCAGRRRTTTADAVDRVIADRLAMARARIATGAPAPLAEFDLVRGLTGLGALLLMREEPPTLLREVLAYLVELAQPISSGGWQLPGWWCADGPGPEPVAGGHANNGVAHGAAGPLALLSLAANQGVTVDGQLGAIDVYARWLETYGSSYWTTRDQVGDPAPAPASRPSWCYGTFGIARARQLAGIARGEQGRRAAAENAVNDALADPRVLGLIRDAGLCHGWAGLLTVTRAVAADSPEPARFAPAITDLERRTRSGLFNLVKPGFLEGRAGAELALSGTSTGWTRALLIN
ncbi:MAG: lanthionine synthetase [Catenulispora sp. 13_1_20CM_3_70_7]|nr:MAG: lanthionine synthetase [Catenulispora sp. 13_1_20CM_3_70_7]